MQPTKLNELLEFPCSFTYKVMGEAKPELVDKVITVIQRRLQLMQHISSKWKAFIKN